MTINISKYLINNNFKRMYNKLWEEENFNLIKTFNFVIASSGCPEIIYKKIINSKNIKNIGYMIINHHGNYNQIFSHDIMSDDEFEFYYSFIHELDGTLLVDTINKLCEYYCEFI